jgi:hypothetical protein
MSIAALWARFSTHQAAIFSAARRDTLILASGYVARPLWTASPLRAVRLSGNHYHQCRDHAIYEFTP